MPTATRSATPTTRTTTTATVVNYGYDANGNATRFTDGNANSTDTTYNSWNLPQTVVAPSVATDTADRTWTTRYDADGHPTTKSVPGAITITDTFDALGRLTQQSGTGTGVTTATSTLGYDAAGRITSIGTPSGAETISYYDRGLVKTTAGPEGTAAYVYNGDATINTETTASGTATDTYDGADRLATTTDPLTGAKQTFAYTPAGLPTGYTSTLPGGAAGLKQAATYDPLDRVATKTASNPGGAAQVAVAYGYDADSNITTKAVTAAGTTATNTYTYDGADRLTNWAVTGGTSTAYAYDAAGNRTKAGATTYTYNARSELISDSTGAAYTYSNDGDLTKRAAGSTSSTYGYDALDRLTNDAGTTYAYDSTGRVATRNGLAFSYTGITNQLAASSGGRFTWLPDGTSNAATIAGVAQALFTDAHDDVTAALTPAGTLVATTTFDPFGAITAATGSGVAQIGYQSGYTDPATSRVNTASRWYTPITDQFTSQDAATNLPYPNAATNKYEYANANPLGDVDPSGHGDCPDPTSEALAMASCGSTQEPADPGIHTCVGCAPAAFPGDGDPNGNGGRGRGGEGQGSGGDGGSSRTGEGSRGGDAAAKAVEAHNLSTMLTWDVPTSTTPVTPPFSVQAGGSIQTVSQPASSSMAAAPTQCAESCETASVVSLAQSPSGSPGGPVPNPIPKKEFFIGTVQTNPFTDELGWDTSGCPVGVSKADCPQWLAQVKAEDAAIDAANAKSSCGWFTSVSCFVNNTARIGNNYIAGTKYGSLLSLTSRSTGLTIGTCVGASGSAAVVGGSGSVCWNAYPNGTTGFTATGSGGFGQFGLGINGMVNRTISNAQSGSDLSKWFWECNGSAKLGPYGVDGGGAVGETDSGRGIWTATGGWAPGAGAGGGCGPSYTWVEH